MRYANIEKFDINNGIGVGISLFVQGCHFHCKNCFNPSTWNFNNGNEFTNEIKDNFLSLLNKKCNQRVSVLGGEPLCCENIHDVYNLCKEIKEKYPNKQVWIFSGYIYEDIIKNSEGLEVLMCCDVLVDGQFIEELKDVSLAFRGSSNQRLIDVKKSLQESKVVLWE